MCVECARNVRGMYVMCTWHMCVQDDLKLSDPSSDQCAGRGARTHDRTFPADTRADSLPTVPRMPIGIGGSRVSALALKSTAILRLGFRFVLKQRGARANFDVATLANNSK
ncbi:hypothetical protein PoB_007422500 [Plakobranchus ocellatus]|uniref:Uncharacterized protein n=1 Tax=Plakobranchus ocellatus TaxID=259542 RepID=A0AAV4DUS2_9GAST|nr:hypothetical protein PoB_007422500 [Plakobranchus ocellatus]